ncbi:hypothetical protein OHT61_01065 [Streptomyces sp. NBC_00178]|uniref:hypothetical protein n=1 Tax=Streptomyces sp. NBC_00178 TaxID=2975672 RepID=UPI002E2CF9D5|nr:hypothetical protein [Streptomyces sp. NBC_00178]
MTDGTPVASQPRRPRKRGTYAPARLDESEILRRGLDTIAELGYAATTVREPVHRARTDVTS